MKKPAFCATESYGRIRPDRTGRNRVRTKASREGTHFHADDFDWDDPLYAVRLDDPRWILDPRIHPVAGHPWHEALSEEDKIRFGMQMVAHTSLVGAQFELGLNAGIMRHAMNLSTTRLNPDSEKSRKSETRWSDNYMLDEAREEMEHVKLFLGLNEQIQRAGVETTKGGPEWFRNHINKVLSYLANSQPVGFWSGVYAGEAPIDYVQKNMLELHDSGEVELPDVLADIMNIHRREESRHIGFAKDYLLDHTGTNPETGESRLSDRKQHVFAGSFVVSLTVANRLMTYPDKEARRVMDFPDDVAKEVNRSEATKLFKRDLCADPRELAFKMGILDTKVGRAAWKAAGIHDEEHLQRLRAA